MQWWILCGGAIYGLAGAGTNLCSIIARILNSSAPVGQHWTRTDWQYFCGNLVWLCGNGLLASVSVVAMRRPLRRDLLWRLLAIATGILSAVTGFFFALYVIRNGFSTNDSIRYAARIANYTLWPFVMLWTLTDVAHLDALSIRRRLWMGVAAFGLTIGIAMFLTATTVRPVELVIFIAIVAVAMAVAVRGETRAARIAVAALLLAIITLEMLNLAQWFPFGRSAQRDYQIIVLGQCFSLLKTLTPMIIAALSGRAIAQRGTTA